MPEPIAGLKIFQEQTYSVFSEMLDYQINLFNQATGGGLTLVGSSHQGDYNEVAMWALAADIVKRRDAYGGGDVAEKTLSQILETGVKVAAGTYPVRIDQGMMRWIQRDPNEPAAVVGKNMAEQALADMVAAAIRTFRAAHEQHPELYYDGSAVGDGLCSLKQMNKARAKYGDRAGSIVCWLIHSKPLFDMYDQALTNANLLFNFGNVKVAQDAMGNPFVVSDNPQLSVLSDNPDTYRALGLTPGAIVVGRNNDFDDNIEKKNGKENIVKTYQAEWSFQVNVKGFSWDKTAGGHSPTDAALGTSTNWDKYVTSFKDCGGVVLKTL